MVGLRVHWTLVRYEVLQKGRVHDNDNENDDDIDDDIDDGGGRAAKMERY
jgi:hypothetical protein